jgi:hypothetical protein
MSKYHTKYLYRFGYQSRSQIGTDDEDSQCVWITAESADAALSWGRLVSERYVSERWPDCPSWISSGYAHWIEISDLQAIEWAEKKAPECSVGVFPQF